MIQDTDRYDFFVSYARADNTTGWITQFVEGLLVEHRKFSGGRSLVPFFDRDEIKNGDDWQHRLHHGLASSRLFLAFISPEYFASEWCRKEWRTWIDTEIAKHILSDGAAAVYIIEVPGLLGRDQLSEQDVAARISELCPVLGSHDAFVDRTSPMVRQMRRRQFSAVQPFYTEGIEALRREALHLVLEGLARDLDERAERVRRASESASTVPPYNRRFTGRLEELLALREQLTNDRAGVICGVAGLGGVGKSELAFTYAHAFASAYPGGRFHVPCEGRTSLRDAVLHLGEHHEFRARIDDEARKSPDTHFTALAACLNERLARLGHILLVLDNVTDSTLLNAQQTDVLTALGPKLHLLATTRNAPAAGQKGRWLTLGELPEGDALDLLEKHRPFRTDAERDAGKRIVRQLGGFTLAVELVAAYLAAHESASYAQLAEGLALGDLEQIADDQEVELRRHNHERRLSAVLGPVLVGLPPAERRTLEYAALLPPDQLPLPWLQTLVTRDFPELGQPGRFGDPWTELWQRMMRQALLSRVEGESSEPRLIRAHRLLQELVRRGLTPDDHTTRQNALNGFIRERAAILDKTTEWVDARWEIEPLDILAHQWADAGDPSGQWLLGQVGHFATELALWTCAEVAYRRALALAEKRYPNGHPDLATNWYNLGTFLAKLQRSQDETETLLRKALAAKERSYGPDHPQVSLMLHALASALGNQNKPKDQEECLRRSLAIDEQNQNLDSSGFSTVLNNLASCLMSQSRPIEAEPFLRRAMEIEERSGAGNQPRYAAMLNNMAIILGATGRGDEEEAPLRHALAIEERCFGPDHPRLSITLVNLSGHLADRKKTVEAVELARRALAISEAGWGVDHPRAQSARNQLKKARSAHGIDLATRGIALMNEKRFTESEAFFREALAFDEKEYGTGHTEVGTDLQNLASLMTEQERWTEAEPLLRRALAIAEAANPPQFVKIATRLRRLAEVIGKDGRHVEAESLYRKSIETAEQLGSAGEAELAYVLNAYAVFFGDQGRSSEAEPLYRRAIELATQTLGNGHPDVAAMQSNLERLRSSRTREPGPSAESIDLTNKGIALRNAQDHLGAEPLFRRVLDLDEKALGLENSNVGVDLYNLGMLLNELQKYTESEPLLRRSLTIAERQATPDPKIVEARLNQLCAAITPLGKVDEAITLQLQRIAILEKQGDAFAQRLANALNDLGVLFINHQRSSEAKPHLESAVEMASKAFGLEHETTKLIRANLTACSPMFSEAVQFSKRGVALWKTEKRLAEAEPLLRRAWELTRKELGPEHTEYETHQWNLGVLLVALERYTEAEPLIRGSLALAEGRPVPNTQDILARLEVLSSILGKLGRIDETISLDLRRVEKLEKSGEEGSKDLGIALNNLGVTFIVLKRFRDAEESFRRALQLYEKHFGGEHTKTASVLTNLAAAANELGKAEDAVELSRRTLKIREKLLGPDHLDVAKTYNQLAVYLHESFRYFEAEPLFRKAIGIFVRSKAAGNGEHPFQATSVRNYQSTLNELGKTPDQITAALRAISPDLAP